ncbi:RNB domain-containing ribonuclease, partial [Burkholderia pseudomallei]
DVLIEFENTAAGELMQKSYEAAKQIDLDYLWECAPAEEFAYAALADEYFGASYVPVERAALVLLLHVAPVYFRSKGR